MRWLLSAYNILQKSYDEISAGYKLRSSTSTSSKREEKKKMTS